MPRKPIPGRVSLGTAYGNRIPQGATVGVRVYILMRMDNGQLVEGSVTINAVASDLIGDILAAGVDWADAGNMGLRSGMQYKGQVIEARVYQLILGGIDSPALDLT